MPAQKRFKTNYPGVVFIKGMSRTSKPERIFYIRYRKNGKQVEEKAGKSSDGITPARAAILRSNRISGKQATNSERRQAEKARKMEEAGRWTIKKLWTHYSNTRAPGKSYDIDKGRFTKYLSGVLGDKEPKDLNPLEIDRLRIRLGKTLSPQTVRHILNLLTWIINYGVNNGYCSGIPFKIKKPTVDNKKTEDLTEEQFHKLLQVLNDYPNIQAANLMKLAAFTGIRRGGLFDLQWTDIDFDRRFITIRNKGGKDEILPMNDMARQVLESHPRSASSYVFPGKHGERRVTIQSAARDIAKKAGLPKDFRPLHGLRHVYASMLASSGQVDMYTLQKLLTHKSPQMTQRYAHLRDEALRRASDLAGDLINNVIEGKDKKKVQSLDGHS